MSEQVKMTPFYNHDLHPPGTLVKHWVGDKLVEFIVPEIDLDGKPLEAGSPGRLTVEKPNTKRPKFRQMPKPEKKRKEK